MPGRGNNLQADVAEVELVFVLEVSVGKTDISGLVHEDRRPGRFGEPPGARNVIGLHVGLDDVADPHVLLSRRFEVGLDVLLWIHHSAAGCAASAEHVARAAGLRRKEVAEDH